MELLRTQSIEIYWDKNQRNKINNKTYLYHKILIFIYRVVYVYNYFIVWNITSNECQKW